MAEEYHNPSYSLLVPWLQAHRTKTKSGRRAIHFLSPVWFSGSFVKLKYRPDQCRWNHFALRGVYQAALASAFRGTLFARPVVILTAAVSW